MTHSPEQPHQPSPELQPHAIFDDFAWQEASKPESLRINESGFTEDNEGNWYMVRKARNAVDLATALPHNLYNGPRDRYWNSTEGRGLYFANHPAAVEKLKLGVRSSQEPSELYVCRIKPDAGEVLDVTTSIRHMDAGQKAAAILLRSRSIFPGIPSPNRRTYDRMYGDSRVVVTPPLAMSRLLTGNSAKIEAQKIKIRWAIVRQPEALQVVAHRAAR